MTTTTRAITLVDELREFWPRYVRHHRRPWTRRLHHVGSWTCIAGLGAALLTRHGWFVPAGIAVGYLFAFAGHWVVERNRPLTFGRPVFAGICNWIMFALEVTGRMEPHLHDAEQHPEHDDPDVTSC